MTNYFVYDAARAAHRARARERMRRYRERKRRGETIRRPEHICPFRKGMAVVVLPNSRHRGRHVGKLGWVVSVCHKRKYPIDVAFDLGHGYFAESELAPAPKGAGDFYKI